MKREDLIHQLVEKHNYTKEAAKQVIDDFTAIVIDNMREGNTVSIYGFGVFDMVERKERSCPNPITGETIVIPMHWTPKFYPGNRMKAAVKIWEDNEIRGIR